MDREEKKIRKNRVATLAVALVTSFIATFSSSALNLAIPSIALEFGSRATFTGWIVTGYMLCIVTLSVPVGRLADLRGRRGLLMLGILIFSVFSGLTLPAWSTGYVILMRVMQGVGTAMILSTNVALLIHSFPAGERGKVLGYSVAMTYLGLSLGPVMGGLLTQRAGWRSVFMVSMCVGLLSLIIAAFWLPRESGTKKGARPPWNWKELNIPGMILFMAMVFSLMYGFSEMGARPLPGVSLAVVGVLLLIFFVRHELKAAHPVVEIRIFLRNSNYLLSNLAALFNYAATFATGYLLSIYLQVIMDFDPGSAGLILICQPLVMAVISPFMGRLSDRISPFRLASAGMALCAIALFSYIFVGLHTPLVHVIINLLLVGCGFGLFSSPNTNAIMSCVPPKDYSVASSVLSTMRSMGHVVSMAIITLIMGATLGNATFEEAAPARMVQTMHTSFIVFASICAAGILLSLQRKQQKKSEENAGK